MHRRYLWFVLGTFALPFAVGFLVSGTLQGALTALLWGGFVCIALLRHTPRWPEWPIWLRPAAAGSETS